MQPSLVHRGVNPAVHTDQGDLQNGVGSIANGFGAGPNGQVDGQGIVVEVLERRLGDVHRDGDFLCFARAQGEILVKTCDGGAEPRVGFAGVKVHDHTLTGGVLVDDTHGNFDLAFFSDFHGRDGEDAKPVLRADEIGGFPCGADAAVGNAGSDDLEVQAALGAFDERKLDGNVVAGPDVNFRGVPVDEVRERSVHSVGNVETHGETVRAVAVVSNFKRHRLGQISGDVGLAGFFIRDVDSGGFQDFDDEFHLSKHGLVIDAGSCHGDGVIPRVQANGHGELNHDGRLPVPCVKHGRLIGRERGLEAPVALTDAQVVLLVVITEVVQVEVKGLGDAVGCSREGVFFGHEVYVAENWDLDITNKDIGAKQGRAARRTGGSQVEGNRARAGLFRRGNVEHEVHALSLVERDGVGLDDTRFVLDDADPTRVVRERGGEVECRIAVAGVLETEVHQTVVVGTDGGGHEWNRRGQGDAELLADGQVHAKAGLFTKLGAAGVGQPKVPILLLNISASRDRQVRPELDCLPCAEWRHDDVGSVVAAAFNVHTNDGERRHPRIVGDVGLKAHRGRSVAVVRECAIQGGHLVGSDGVAVKRVVALHVDGVIGHAAHAEVNEVIDVEAFAGHAAVRGEQHGKGVGTTTEEDLWVGEVGDLLPRDLRVPREVGPLTGRSAGITLSDVP